MSGRLSGEALPSLGTRVPGPRSLELAGRLRGVESRNVTYLAPDFPVFWEEARGANVRDVDGNVYLDLTGAFGVAAAGHSNPRIAARIAEQGERLVHGMGDVHPPALKVELLERLVAISPLPDSRVVLASSGSEAVEIALKTALLVTDRPGILAFEGGYHGLTIGALAASGRRDFQHPFSRRLYGGVALAPFPDALRHGARATEQSLKVVEAALAAGGAGGDAIGTVIIEPIQGRNGVRLPPPGFLAELASLVRGAGALLVFDEIFTGMGRTGSLFACQDEGVLPDILCIGKALGGGLPLSACIAPRAIMDAWPESTGEALHTSTFLGHPLACAAALAYLDEVEAEGLVERARRMGSALLARLREELAGVMVNGADAPAGRTFVGEVRGRGLFIGIELVDAELAPAAGAGVAISTAALGRGLIVLPAGSRGEVVELSPPLTLTEEQADFAAKELGDLIRGITAP